MALADFAMLDDPAPMSELTMMVDASQYAVSAVVQQMTNTSWQLLAYFSKKLSNCEHKYSTYDRDMLAI